MTSISSIDLDALRAIERARPAWPHQISLKKEMKGKPAHYIAMEPRCGKTRPVLEEVAELYHSNLIDALLIIAMPSGAPRNWIDDEIPIWLDLSIPRSCLLWKANKTKLVGVQQRMAELLTFKGLSILAINGEGVVTETFKKYITKFLTKRRAYVVGDEMTLLAKTPGNKRTKAMYGIAGKSVIRRALDGTPVGEGPMDLFSQYTFLDPNILGYTSFYAFRNRYAVVEKQKNWSTGIEYDAIKEDDDGEPMYQNLDELQAKIAPFTTRVLFKDVFPNVPEPIYSKHYFDLHPLQRKAYDELKEEYETELQGLGQVTAAHVLTRYLRLQQICSGYWPPQKRQPTICPQCDGNGCPPCNDLGVLMADTPMTRIVPFKDNPRLEGLHDELLQMKGRPAIIWGRFNQDIDDCMQLVTAMGRKPVQYDGRVDDETKYRNKAAFQSRQADTFIGKTTSAGRAVRVDTAESMYFYSNEFGLLQRLQGEMRTQTGDRTITTGICDLVANQTLDDELLIPALRSKKSMADLINRDKNGRWL